MFVRLSASRFPTMHLNFLWSLQFSAEYFAVVDSQTCQPSEPEVATMIHKIITIQVYKARSLSLFIVSILNKSLKNIRMAARQFASSNAMEGYETHQSLCHIHLHLMVGAFRCGLMPSNTSDNKAKKKKRGKEDNWNTLVS